MLRIPIECEICHKPLEGGTDTYGEVGREMCWECWSGLVIEPDCEDDYYGLAPHHHDLTITDSMIGSTVFDPLPKAAEDGRYWIEARGEWFWPDEEVGGKMGIWSRC